MTRAELKSAAKEQINGNVGKYLVMMLIIFAINAACGFIPVIGPIISFVIMPAFALSLVNFFIKLTKNEEVAIGDVFSGFNKTGRALLMNIFVSIFTFLWSLLLVIPGIIKAYAYSMSYYILAENPELTANQCITRSKEMMQGHKWDLFVLDLSFFWWYLLVLITFGLAAIYVAPYRSAAVANFYNSIKGDEIVSDAQPVVEA